MLDTPEEVIQEMDRKLNVGDVQGALKVMQEGALIAIRTYGYNRLTNAIIGRSGHNLLELEQAMKVVADFAHYNKVVS